MTISLAGLFALWAACQTDLFSGVAASSPSVWFPEFLDYIKIHVPKTQLIYLSLGDKEAKTRNPVMAQVSNCIREGYQQLQESTENLNNKKRAFLLAEHLISSKKHERQDEIKE